MENKLMLARLGALLLLAFLLLSETGAALASREEQSVEEELAKSFRSLLAEFALGSTSYDEAASILRALASCSKEPVAQAALGAAEALQSNTSLAEKRTALDHLLESMIENGVPYTCPSSLLYRAYLVVAMDPTPLGMGVVDPAKSIQRLSAILGTVLRMTGAAGTRVEEIVFTYYPSSLAKGMNPYAAIHGMAMTAALAGRVDDAYWRRTLLLDRAALRLLAALTNPVVLQSNVAKRMLIIVFPEYSPSEPERLLMLSQRAYNESDTVSLAALAGLSVAAYPVRAKLLARIVLPPHENYVVVYSVGGFTPSLLGSRAVPAFLRTDSGDYVVPAAYPLAIGARAPAKGLANRYKGGLIEILMNDILEAGYDPVNWTIVGGEASIIVRSEPSDISLATITTLIADPFAPLDPWLLSKDVYVPGAQEALKRLEEGGVDALVEYALTTAHPWPAVLAIAALNTYERGLLQPVSLEDIKVFMSWARIPKGTNPFKYCSISIASKKAAEIIASAKSPEEIVKRIGYLARYASLRYLEGKLVVNYGAVRGLVALLEKTVPGLNEAFNRVAEENPVLVYWARGLIETPSPTNTVILVKEDVGDLAKAAARLREAAASPSNINASSVLGKAAKQVEQVAASIESGNIPEAVLLAKRIRQSLEAGGKEAEVIKKALGEEGVADLVKALERVETLGGTDAAKIAGAKRVLEELAKEAEKQGKKGLAEKLRKLAEALGEGRTEEARSLAKEVAKEASSAGGELSALSERLGRLFQEKPQPTLREIAEAITGSQPGGQGVVDESIREIIELIRKGRFEEAAKSLEEVAKENPEQAARAIEELQQAGLNVSEILSHMNPEAVNKLVKGVLKTRASRAITINTSGEILVAENNASNTSLKLPGAPQIPRPRISSNMSTALLLATVTLAAAALLLWLSSPARIEALRSLAEPVAARMPWRRQGAQGGLGDAKSRVVAEFSKLLSILSKTYAPREPSETHREYARKLPEEPRRLYEEAALAYEEAKFSNHPVSEHHLEVVRRALRGLLRRRGT
ncbi:hypothetical protein PYJP_01760 [Pyrofollis japonicus]|nr:hypothetical protein PYJP_01760 [Pyrofollis japonicus]